MNSDSEISRDLSDEDFPRNYVRVENKSSSFGDFLKLQCEPKNFTDVQLSLRCAVFLIHSIILFSCSDSSALMVAYVSAKQANSPPVQIRVPERIGPEVLAVIIRYLYLGEVICSTGYLPDLEFALEWAGIGEDELWKVTKPWHNSFIEEQARIHRNYFIRYSEKGQDFFIDSQGKSRRVNVREMETSISYSHIPPPLPTDGFYCDSPQCGRVFVDHVKSGCQNDTFKLARAPSDNVTSCQSCNKSFLKSTGNENPPNEVTSTVSSKHGRSRLEQHFEGSPIVSATNNPSLITHNSMDDSMNAFCADCRTHNNQDDSPRRAPLHSTPTQGPEPSSNLPVGSMQHFCKLCNRWFRKATSTGDGIFKHFADTHAITEGLYYMIQPVPKCLMCIKRNPQPHPKESPEEFLYSLSKCEDFQKNNNKRNPGKLPRLKKEVIFEDARFTPNPLSQHWYEQIPSVLETTKRKRTRSNSRNRQDNPGNNMEIPGNGNAAPSSPPPLPTAPARKKLRPRAKK